MEKYGAQTPRWVGFFSIHSSCMTSITEDCSCILEKVQIHKRKARTSNKDETAILLEEAKTKH